MEIDFVCPICNGKISNCEIKTHCDFEFKRLKESSEDDMNKDVILNHEASNSLNRQNLSSFNIFQKVKNNRQSRKENSRKRPQTSSNEPLCPVCNLRPQENINVHVEKCLKNSVNGSDDESIDIEGESFDEYDLAYHKRSRSVNNTFSDGLPSEVGETIRNLPRIEEDEDLNVDGDDTAIYGPSQYYDSDVILLSEESFRNDFFEISAESSSVGSDEDFEGNNLLEHRIEKQSKESTKTIIKTLKLKIRDLEKNNKNKIKCLICLEDPKDPAVSVCCWHVHCELCWLRTLGSRKLCPQCNSITTPTDLRRIYM